MPPESVALASESLQDWRLAKLGQNLADTDRLPVDRIHRLLLADSEANAAQARTYERLKQEGTPDEESYQRPDDEALRAAARACGYDPNLPIEVLTKTFLGDS